MMHLRRTIKCCEKKKIKIVRLSASRLLNVIIKARVNRSFSTNFGPNPRTSNIVKYPKFFDSRGCHDFVKRSCISTMKKTVTLKMGTNF
jgi:hypothetical protein